MKPPVLHIDHLEVRRSTSFTLHIPYLEMALGRVLCLVGANGSGKSTLVEAVAGLVLPTHGQILVCGEKQEPLAPATRRRIGYIPDDDAWIIPELTAGEYFVLLESIHRPTSSENTNGIVRSLAHRLGFVDFDHPCKALSHGNRKKVQLIAGLMHSPELLVVDELRNGLDPIAINAAEDILHDAASRGTAILAATHDLFWAERFADDILMLKDGSIALADTTENIITKHGSLERRLLELYREEHD